MGARHTRQTCETVNNSEFFSALLVSTLWSKFLRRTDKFSAIPPESEPG
jgi:hypothetical protein